MQIHFTLRSDRPLAIPFHYQYQLQSALYALLSDAGLSDFWHDGGFGGSVKFKGFCFSGLQGKYAVNKEQRSIRFENDVSLEVRSPVFSFIDSLQRAVERRPYLTLFDTRLAVDYAALENRHLQTGRVVFNATTPVVAHRTLEDLKTAYYSPEEPDYFIHICENAEKKYMTVTGESPDALRLRACGPFRKTVTRYKSTWITGYTGAFEADTSVRMAEFLYNVGLGEKNSQGFGFITAK